MLSLLINVVIPTIVMTRFSGEDRLGPVGGLLVALVFPFVYAIYDMARQRKVGLMPVVGLVSIMLSGGIGLLKLPAEWIAVKEAMVPALLAVAILASDRMGKPLTRTFLNSALNADVINPALEARGTTAEYLRRTSKATWMLAGAFLLSAALNFILAKIIVTADGGTEQYTQQLGRMTALSPLVITVPVFIVLFLTILYVFNTVTNLTGLEVDQILVDQKKPKNQPPDA